MLGWIGEMFLRSGISKDNVKRQKHFLTWEKIERIALILDKKDNINKSEVDKLLESTKKFFEVFYIELSSAEPSYGDWRCFFKKDKSILGLPKSVLQIEMRKKKFDVVINTLSDDNLFAQSITLALQAPMKCDCTEKFSQSDLIIRKNPGENMISHLQHVFNYLKMIRARD